MASYPISILTYHSVHPAREDYAITPARFREHMELVAEHYRVARLSDLDRVFGDPDGRTVIVTFDDALDNFLEYAYPVLQALDIPATLFVPTGLVGRANLWDVEVPGVRSHRILDCSALRTLNDEGRVDLGSHTVDHVAMGSLTHTEMQS